MNSLLYDPLLLFQQQLRSGATGADALSGVARASLRSQLLLRALSKKQNIQTPPRVSRGAAVMNKCNSKPLNLHTHKRFNVYRARDRLCIKVLKILRSGNKSLKQERDLHEKDASGPARIALCALAANKLC
jgi:hypothetical protein